MRSKMSKVFVLTGLVGVLLGGSIAAQERGFGLGIILGEPTGLSAKLWTGAKTAFDAAAAWSIDEKDTSYLHADYLVHNFNLLTLERDSLPFYYGIGGTVRLTKNERAGIRLPLGLAYIFEDAGVDIFLEVVPLFFVLPDTNFSINSGLGIRYFFR